MTEIKLPEKLYFTLEELATRWQCDESDIRHYIDEGMLRPSIEGIELDEFALQLITDLSGLEGGRSSEAIDQWRSGGKYVEWTENPEHAVRWCDLPRFLYINARYRIDAPTEWQITVLETFDGKEYALADNPPPGAGPTECSPFRLDITHSYIRPVITLEERDRFEGRAKLAGGAVSGADAYSTPIMDVMREAVAEFFEPRRSVDPKKAEVVDWVHGRLGEKGLASNNIAEAIFTIIKPDDHDPRKRRG